MGAEIIPFEQKDRKEAKEVKLLLNGHWKKNWVNEEVYSHNQIRAMFYNFEAILAEKNPVKRRGAFALMRKVYKCEE